ncbi:sensor histidine kinase [Celeribacter sp. ULVN23_4]
MRKTPTLRVYGTSLILIGALVGIIAASLWLLSGRAWQAYLTRAEMAGIGIYQTLRLGDPAPEGVEITSLNAADSAFASQGAFARLSIAPRPSHITVLTLIEETQDPLSGEALTVAILSNRLNYAVGEVTGARTVTRQVGALTRLMASYCSEPVLVVRRAEGPWLLVKGPSVWNCDAAPSDLRLGALLSAAVALLILVTKMANAAQPFERIAQALRSRTLRGGPDVYEANGPRELREIVDAINANLADERARLEKRAVVLSGVSHDLGTPATRLRLRATLISDPSLRSKFEADIAQMTSMIESVLTYTRSELSTESPRDLSLTSLVESVVADYQDLGAPVELVPVEHAGATGVGSLFSANRGHGKMTDPARILVAARPVSLTRAISNLIDNALKYGRAAHVSLTADAHEAIISIEDEGNETSLDKIETLLAPFTRGENTGGIDGVGLGLTIVGTVAESHGGRLEFDIGQRGLVARLIISRMGERGG